MVIFSMEIKNEGIKMTKYVKIKSDLNSQTFLYVLENQVEKIYIICKILISLRKVVIYF